MTNQMLTVRSLPEVTVTVQTRGEERASLRTVRTTCVALTFIFYVLLLAYTFTYIYLYLHIRLLTHTYIWPDMLRVLVGWWC